MSNHLQCLCRSFDSGFVVSRVRGICELTFPGLARMRRVPAAPFPGGGTAGPRQAGARSGHCRRLGCAGLVVLAQASCSSSSLATCVVSRDRDGAPDRIDQASRWALTSGAPALLWTLIGCPFDVIKTRLQTATTPFTSPLHCLWWTAKNDGIRTLWKGFVPQLLTSTPYSIIMFGTYQALKPTQDEDVERSGYIGSAASYIGGCALAGAASGVAVTAVHNPLELWRVRVQTHLPLAGGKEAGQAGAPTNRTVLRNLLKRPWQLGRGASMTLAENVVGNAVFFGSNEAMRRYAARDGSWAAEFLVGGLTGVAFQIVVYPMDLVKARLMTQDKISASQVAREILRAHGVPGLYRGASVAVLRAFAINAAGWPALRAAQSWLGVTA